MTVSGHPPVLLSADRTAVVEIDDQPVVASLSRRAHSSHT
jgi:hypothetical protein